jgi:hypothetical protein
MRCREKVLVMPIADVNIGTKRIWLTAYNPSDALARAYCAFAVARAAKTLRDVPLDEVHAWIREHLPELAGVIDAAEAGQEIPRDVPAGSYPLTPGQEQFELPIASHLQRLRSIRKGQSQ